MSVMSMNSRMAMAEKLSIPQLQQAIQSGSLPAYIGVPLIEQKTREKSQMAAASQGQQEPRPSITQQILQQAEQQQRQQADPGIDQLPSNLPQGDDEEMGMANGGIIAFAEPTAKNNNSLVTDPDQDPRIIALRQDPSYLAFAENAAAEGKDPSLTAFLETGNIPTPPRQTTSGRPTPLGITPQMLRRIQADKNPEEMKVLSREAEQFANEIKSAPAPSIAPGTYNLTNPGAVPPSLTNEAMNIPANRGGPQGIADLDSQYITQDNQEGNRGMPNAGLDSQYVAQDMQEGNRGITPLADNRGAAPSSRGAVNTSGATRPSTGNRQPSVGETPPQTAGGSTTSPATSLIDRYTKMLEAQGEDSAQARRNAKGMAIFQAGLGIAGGTSPNAFANISQGALPAIQGYQQALQGLRKEDRERVGKLLEAGLSKEKLAIELQKLGIENKKVDAMVNYYNARAGAGAAGSGGSDTKNNATYNLATRNYDTGIGNIDKQIAKLKENTAYQFTGKSPALIASKKTIQDQIDVLEGRKTNMSKQYRSFVTERLGIDVPDFSGDASAGNRAPAVGTVKNGYKFKGGNPGDPNSWEKV